MLSAEFEAMIRDVSRSFAKRLVQEAAMQETNWFVAHPEVTRYILQHEQAQELIGRMCAAPLVIQYEEGDELVHTDEHPECDDPDCPCHWGARIGELDEVGKQV